MVNKRGLSPSEFNDLPEGLFNYLQVFDALVEPSGVHIDMLYHCYSQYNNTMLSPNITKETRKKISLSDYDFMNIIGDNNGLTSGEKKEFADKKLQEKKDNSVKLLGERIKQAAMNQG
ncbi:hypothetical protein GKQ23_13030 [Erwinia sp. E602]|uniref:hypothetical protein n=1 Tax=Erwinia sp. E602 TaxID=2675378 RepID=UPI001BACB016|nr:hypothetical protein [Erwinia sp. E602]QUG75860.1 hypothetical protein GKQ23_13030 [Erwinia sp. E602]